MPNPTTHNYFAKDVLKKSPKYIIDTFLENQKIYELFAQGFDPFFTYEQIPFHEKLGNLCHQNNTDTFFLNYIKIIKEKKWEKNSSVLAALYGHLTHYILDSTIHPYVIFKTGEYDKTKPETIKYKGLHHKMEMQIDAYLYEKREHKKFKNFKIHKLISLEKWDNNLLNILNQNYEEVFSIKKGGKKYKKSIHLVHTGLRFLMEDKTGIKKLLWKKIDKMTPKKETVLEDLSTYITTIDNSIFNLKHNTWMNPWDKNLKSTDSFFDLYKKATATGVELFEATYQYINNQMTKKEYMNVLKDYSYVTGLSWHTKKEMKYIEF